MATIFHLALASDWAAAQEAGAYTISTRGRTLAEEGFIHASRGDQWPTVRDLFYGDVTEPLLLLQVDTDRLDVPVVEEPSAPGAAETFPHIYGPIALDAVVKAIPVPSRSAGLPAPPTAAVPAPAAVHPPPSTSPAGDTSFGRILLTEMFVNMTLLVLIWAAAAIGLVLGATAGEETAPLVGVAAGALVGAGLARWLFLRRHAGRRESRRPA